MLAMLAVALLTAQAPVDTLFTADGGRVRGSVVEENSQGVTIQLVDGTTRRYEDGTVTRVEYGDGSVSVRKAPAPPAPAAQPPPMAPAPVQPAAAQPPTVIYMPVPAAAPAAGAPAPAAAASVAIPVAQPPGPQGGAAQPPTVIVVQCPAPPAPAPAPAPAPVIWPKVEPQQAPPRPPAPVIAPQEPLPPLGRMPPASPFYMSLGIGALGMGGEIQKGVSTRNVFSDQVDILMEAGFRLSPSTGLGAYLDIGAGEPSQEVRALPECAAEGATCTATTGRIGLLLKHTFEPTAPRTAWIGVGTGAEFADVSVDRGMSGGSQSSGPTSVFGFTGWEAFRLMVGYDFRTSPIFGLGFYGGLAWGKYTETVDPAGNRTGIADPSLHTTSEVGVRVILFP